MIRNQKVFLGLTLMVVAVIGFSACSTGGRARAAKDPQKFIREHSLSKLPKFDIPVELNDRVVAWMEYFQGPGRNHFRRYLERSGRYVPLMQEILKKHNMPKDLIYIALIESGFNTSARSSASAVGPWQFISGTGKRYNLRIDGWVDERRDPYKSTVAAAEYFKDLYGEFKDWYLAMAGYNAGEGRVRQAIDATGSHNFWEIVDSGKVFRPETRDYVPKFIAAAIMAKTPERFGFEGVDYKDPFDFEMGRIESQTDIEVIAKCAGVSEDVIADLNPHLVRGATPPEERSYEIRVPRGTAKSFQEKYAVLPKEERMQLVHYQTKRGDTLSKVARRFGVNARTLAQANGVSLGQRHLQPGTMLTIPVGAAASKYALAADVDSKSQNGKQQRYTVKRGDTVNKIAARFGITTKQLLAWNNIKNAKGFHSGMRIVVRQAKGGQDDVDSVGVVATKEHKVQKGDTLSTIARRYGVTTKQLMALNNLKSEKSLRSGTRLVVRASKTPTPVRGTEGNTVATPLENAKAEKDVATAAREHKIAAGETLGAIAKKYNITVKELMAQNNITDAKSIRMGKSLVIEPSSKKKVQAVAKVTENQSTEVVKENSQKVAQSSGAPLSLSDKLMDNTVQTQAPAAANAEAKPAEGTPVKLADAHLVKDQNTTVKKEMPKAVNARALSYQVKSGDTLWDIARRHKVTIAELQKWNNLGDKSAVKPGVTLTIKTVQ